LGRKGKGKSGGGGEGGRQRGYLISFRKGFLVRHRRDNNTNK